jgi:hypothetical protein
MFRRDAESPSRTGGSTRDACATRNAIGRHAAHRQHLDWLRVDSAMVGGT